jgi:hypothetical protein
MLLQGVHPKVASERLGHASVGITLDTYSHFLPTMQTEAVRAFDQRPRVALAGWLMLGKPHTRGAASPCSGGPATWSIAELILKRSVAPLSCHVPVPRSCGPNSSGRHSFLPFKPRLVSDGSARRWNSLPRGREAVLIPVASA